MFQIIPSLPLQIDSDFLINIVSASSRHPQPNNLETSLSTHLYSYTHFHVNPSKLTIPRDILKTDNFTLNEGHFQFTITQKS